MPELPEVEIFKRYFDSTSIGKQIQTIEVKDIRILELDKKIFIDFLKNKKFQSTRRHGKYLFVNCGTLFLIMHFGMSGDLEHYSQTEPEPPYSKVLFKFTDKTILAYISIRMFGKLDITQNINDYIKLKKLGPDALNMNYEDFLTSLQRRTTNMKSALMNQSIVCGIGNIYSDEILFKSKINPMTKINSLDEKQVKELFSNIKTVLNYGIKKKGILSTYSDKFLIPHRSEGDDCPSCKTSIKRYELLGRHGFYCPKCQK